MARPLSEEARQKALTASQAVIAEHGINGFTVDAVARRSGVAKSTIYRHWESGNALLVDSIGCMITAFPTPNTGSFAGDLRAFMNEVVPQLGDPTMRGTMLGLMAAAASDPELSEIHHTMMFERMTPVATIIELAKGRGEIRPDLDPDLAFAYVEGPFFFRMMVKNDPLDAEVIDELVDLIVAGLANA